MGVLITATFHEQNLACGEMVNRSKVFISLSLHCWQRKQCDRCIEFQPISIPGIHVKLFQSNSRGVVVDWWLDFDIFDIKYSIQSYYNCLYALK